jgi:UPF0755 protein
VDAPAPRSNGSEKEGQQSGEASTGPGDRSANGGTSVEAKRIAPRSPRAALEPERIPEPRHSRRARHPVVVAGNAVITIIIVVAVTLGTILAVGKQRYEAPGPLANDRVVNIPRNLGVRDIADLLQREGVIDQPWLFIGSVLALKAREDLKFGEYEFKREASVREVIDILVEGKVVEHRITFPEGLTSEQIVARLLENEVLTGPLKEIPKEGVLLPDTYKFKRGDTRERIVALMQNEHRRAVHEAWERRMQDLPLRTPEQLVTLASLIEKETGKADERPRIAAVFINRLKQRMRLQSDPTIIYGLVGGKGTLGRPILKSEIEQPTPYNTYVIDGLPPGPIASPGRAALQAAANPSRTKELYFVSDGAGGHRFAETLDQHLRNVAALRLIEQQREQAKIPAETGAPQAPSAFAPMNNSTPSAAPPASPSPSGTNPAAPAPKAARPLPRPRASTQ